MQVSLLDASLTLNRTVIFLIFYQISSLCWHRSCLKEFTLIYCSGRKQLLLIDNVMRQECFLIIMCSFAIFLQMCDVADKFRSDLMNIAMTTLSSKILSQDKGHFAKLSVDAVMRLKVCIFYN